jgi:uncharacterized protein (DUF2235 family)
MARNLILLFDGTWNNRKDRTNAVRMKESIISSGERDPAQPCFYDPGVGTHWYDRLSGGAFGRGLSENIRQGYAWLCRKYQDGDQIYVFGFSRGAYTARSLVGLIRKCGILRNPHEMNVRKAYDLYRDKNVAPDDPDAVVFRLDYSRETRVRFIGVWDTVGALGIPASHVPFSRDYYRFHDTELSKIVDHAYHAVAVDEHRKDYAVALWTKIKPENREVEQRWFIGAHANVGGGYDKRPPDPLPNRPLRWIQDKAEACGLRLRSKCGAGPDDCLAEVNDSFREFLFGIYKIFQKEFHRPFGAGENETVDETVWERWRKRPDYRPKTLLNHPERPGGAGG